GLGPRRGEASPDQLGVESPPHQRDTATPPWRATRVARSAPTHAGSTPAGPCAAVALTVSTSPDGHPSAAAGAPAGAGVAPAPTPSGSNRSRMTSTIARCGLPATSGSAPLAVATAATIAPHPGLNPVSCGKRGSVLVARNRAPRITAVAAASIA